MIRHFKNIWKKDITKIVTLLFFVLLLAALLYNNFEKDIISLFDAVYFAVVTVSTVGYGGTLQPRQFPAGLFRYF
ncbi:MAG: ion channel [Candidatus Delongbacteria bacterium]|nr:ion channel [Candidatus Delongbacteria bacterium]